MNDQQSGTSGDRSQPTEERMAEFLDEVVQRLQSGEPIDIDLLLVDRPDLVEQARPLVAELARWQQVLPTTDASLPPSELDLVLPEPLSREFAVEAELGRGSFGRVLLARELTPLGRKVAIKTWHGTGREGLVALQRDASFLAEVQRDRPHPNIVQVYAWREAGEQPFLVMQYIPGQSLDKRVEDSGPLDWQRAVRYIADVAEGLLAVHAAGIVHRDVKPANILLDEARDEAVLTDLGVSARLVSARSVIGSRLYMAPEAFRGEAGERSDVYSLAATLFFLITGEVPFQAARLEEMPDLIARGLPLPDPRCAVMPESVEQIIRKGLAADTSIRPSLRQFQAELRGALNHALADALAHPGGDQTVADLRLVISREVAPGRWQVVAATHRSYALERDIRKVPRQAGKVNLLTGDAVRVEVQSSSDGFLTLFNVGPTGNLNLLYPDDPPGPESPPDIHAGESLHILDLELQPPAGRERLFALWTERPLLLSLERMQSLAEKAADRSYLSSRDLLRLRQALQAGEPGECRVALVELEHGPDGKSREGANEREQ
jgi:serine/threonine-protein kinase